MITKKFKILYEGVQKKRYQAYCENMFYAILYVTVDGLKNLV